MTQKIKLCLIDDEEQTLEKLRDLIAMIPGFHVEFATTDPMLGLDFMLAGKADILVTDIVMPHLGGLELINQLSELKIPVIICSGFTKYALEGFMVDAVHFVEKPIKFPMLSKGLKKASFFLQRNPNIKEFLKKKYVIFGEKGSHKRQMIRLEKIEYVEQQGKNSYIFTTDLKKYSVTNNFQTTLNKINLPTLIRIHQSFAVNVLQLKEIMPKECVLASGKILPISRIFKGELLDIMNDRLLT